jgi:hypothetical protein
MDLELSKQLRELKDSLLDGNLHFLGIQHKDLENLGFMKFSKMFLREL